jgi:hypothetical protein
MKLVSSQMFWWKLSLKTTIIKHPNFEVTTFFWFFLGISASTGANRQFHISSRDRTVKEVNIHFGIRWILKIQELALGLRNTNAPNLKLFWTYKRKLSNQSKYSSRRCRQIIFGSEYIWFKGKIQNFLYGL